MADKTKIEWADATISPLYGCSKVSPACANCYAERQARRFSKNPATAKLYAGTVDENGHWTGRLNLFPERMEQALRWERPRRIFVASQSVLFHEDVPEDFLDRVFAYMALAPQHTFLLLTKRAERMREYIRCGGGSCIRIGIRQQIERMGYRDIGSVGKDLPNVHLGVTVENQEQANARIPLLLATPAALRFVSVEPMLGPVDLREWFGPQTEGQWLNVVECGHKSNQYGINHVICGGESGPNARPLHPDWVRDLRDQCAGAGVPFMFKQWGEWQIASTSNGHCNPDMNTNGAMWVHIDGLVNGPIAMRDDGRMDTEPYAMVRVGKGRAGRLLDGVEHLEMPEVKP